MFWKIGSPYKIVYASKNYSQGLNDVSVSIKKPDGSLHQSGLMFEDSDIDGVYYFFLNTNSVDPEGQYVIYIESPSEAHKSMTKVSMLNSLGSSESDSDLSDIEMELDLTKIETDLKIDAKSVELSSEKLSTIIDLGKESIELETYKKEVNLGIEPKKIELELDCE